MQNIYKEDEITTIEQWLPAIIYLVYSSLVKKKALKVFLCFKHSSKNPTGPVDQR